MSSSRFCKCQVGRIVALAGMALVMTPVAAPARARDSDRDRMPDRWERAHGLRVKHKDARRDPDHDALSNLGEYRSRTDPRKPDSDNDCIGDAREDFDHDGVDNGHERHQGTRRRDRDAAADVRAEAICREALQRRKPSHGKGGGTPPPPPPPPPSPPPPGTTPPPAPSGFVSRAGTQLVLNGSPYRFTGLNIYNANSVDNCWYTLGTGSALDSSLAAIGSGKEAMRTWFFQYEATRNGARDWTAFDHTLAVARSRGVRVVATLVNQWGQCEGWSSYPDGYKGESWYANGYRTLPSSPGMSATYRDWVAEVVARYRNDPTILAWQLVNEAEAKTSYGGSCSSTAPATLKAFAADMASLVKSVDPNHLLSLGTIGSGQCGAAGSVYKDLHSVPGLDVCEYHDYTLAAMPGDQWNGLATRLRECGELGKPLFVGELGIATSSVGGLIDRATVVGSKLSAQFAAGVAGILVWDWRDAAHGGSSLGGYEIGPLDPVLGMLSAY
jgi:mannan endo-1,4-beta-mannosidase